MEMSWYEENVFWKKRQTYVCRLKEILNGRFVELFHSFYDWIILLWNHGNT